LYPINIAVAEQRVPAEETLDCAFPEIEKEYSRIGEKEKESA
jgi:hypothetical protein